MILVTADDYITTYTGSRNPVVNKVSWSNNTVWLDAKQMKDYENNTLIPEVIGFHGVTIMCGTSKLVLIKYAISGLKTERNAFYLKKILTTTRKL